MEGTEGQKSQVTHPQAQLERASWNLNTRTDSKPIHFIVSTKYSQEVFQ